MTGAFAGADVGARRRHQLRSSCACSLLRQRRARFGARAARREPERWPPRRCHRTTTPPLPPDVRLMNATAARARRRRPRSLLAATALLWLARQPLFAIRVDHASTATSRATASRRSAPTRRRSWPATSSRMDLRGGAARVRVGAVGAPGGRAPRLAEPPARAARGAPAGRALGRRRAATEKLVNSFGEVFEANVGDVEDDDLPTLAGPGRQLGARAGDARPRSTPVLAPLDARVDALALSGRGSWQATLDSGAERRARPRQRRRSARARRALRRAR